MHVRGQIPAFCLLNCMPSNANSKEEQEVRAFLTDEYQIPCLDSFLKVRRAWRDSASEGLAVHELPKKDPKAIAEMRAVYDELATRVERD